jgi:CheY-like chemotaxis protein
MKKIILVESDESAIDFYRQVFKETDFNVEVASGMAPMMEELRQIRTGNSEKPDMVVMDFVLADGHGIEILKALKKSYFTCDIPVFAFTNYQNPDIDRQMEKLGIRPERYLLKINHTPRELVDAIRCHFNEKTSIA